MQTSAVRAIVTGGASGLGLATVQRLLAGGGKVVVVDMKANEQEIAALGPNCAFVKADVTSEADVRCRACVDDRWRMCGWVGAACACDSSPPVS